MSAAAMNALTVERLREMFSYDPETGSITWAVDRPKAGCAIGQIAGCVDFEGYWALYLDGRKFKAHRVAWLLFYGEWPPMSIDHENEIRSDNRIVNIRLATRSQNAANTGPRANNPHGLKGVARLPSGNWQAQIRVRGKATYLGCFPNKEDAASAYQAAAKAVFGEFAK